MDKWKYNEVSFWLHKTLDQGQKVENREIFIL